MRRGMTLFFTLALICTLALTACGGSSTSTGSGGTAATKAPTGGATTGAGDTVNVTMKDFAFALDKTSVNAGTVTFNIKNEGPSPHNFVINEKEGSLIEMGKTATLKVDLKAGTYKYICNVAGHEQLGMVGNLTVK